VRTFLLIGLTSGFAGWLLGTDYRLAGVTLLAATGALTVAAYVVASSRPGGSPEGTTEAAALVVATLGVLAGLGYLAMASGTTAIVVLALGEKTRVQRFVAHIGEAEMRAALQFAVLALVVLPLLPDGTYGPLGGIRPRSLWAIVLVFTGLNFAGYLARRAVGETRGYAWTGLLGGIVSSTAVTLQFSRQSRTEPGLARSLAIGTIGACTMLFPRVILLASILNPAMLGWLLRVLVPPLVAGLALLAWFWPRGGAQAGAGAPQPGPANPLRLASAIRMAIAFQLALMAIALVREWFGTAGILPTAALLGLTDLDALTVSMSRVGEDAALTRLAATAIAVGILSNDVLKLGLALVLGSAPFRRIAGPGLGVLLITGAAAVWVS
ncbi:MAG: MgtC/SapB family protein, partial [Gemmatimonadota bacterium]